MNWFQNTFNRKPTRVGLALGGGALHGAAHIGVLQVFEREGIHPDIVTGTSVGAIIGAAYAAGKPVDHMARLLQNASWSSLVKLTFPPGLGMFSASPMQEFIRQNIFDLNFCDLQHPFAAVACDILTAKKVVLNSGPVAEAVLASAAFPGVFSPVQIGDQLFVDGGIVDNLPVDVARDMGADYIIAVDLSNPVPSLNPPQNLVDLLFSVIGLMQKRSSRPDMETIDCLIHPEVDEFNPWVFSDLDDMIARGRIAANHVILKLKADLGIS
jgi:NTE family protein